MKMIKTLLVLAFVFAGAGYASAQATLDNVDRNYDAEKQALIESGKVQNLEQEEIEKAQAWDAKVTKATVDFGYPGVTGFTYDPDLPHAVNVQNWKSAVETFKRENVVAYSTWWNTVNK